MSRRLEEAGAWTFKLLDNYSIVILIAIFLLIFIVGLADESVANALTAAAIVSAVFWALYHQGISSWLERPILRIPPFEQEPPLFRLTKETAPDSNFVSGYGYFVHIELQNEGRITAKNCQPFLTGMGKFDSGKWNRFNNWLPVGLMWALDERTSDIAGRPTEEKNLVPFRSYFFNLGCITTSDPEHFKVLVVDESQEELIRHGPGVYCFEVEITADRAKPETKYFYLKWTGEFPEAYEDPRKKITVAQGDEAPPW